MFLLLVIVPAVLIEVALGLWRSRRGDAPGYVPVSALLRTLAYSPCIVVIPMMIALPLPLSVFLAGRALEELLGYTEESRAIFLFGIPEVIVFAVAYRRAERNRRRRLPTSNDPGA